MAVVVPITAAGVTVVNLIGGETTQRAFDRLRQASGFAQAALADHRAEVERVARLAVDDQLSVAVSADNAEPLDNLLRRLLVGFDLDVAVVADASGTLAGSARRDAQFAGQVVAPSDAMLLTGSIDSRVLAADAPIPGGGRLVVGQWIDNIRLRQLARAEEVELTVVDNGRVIAATSGIARLPDRPIEGEFEDDIGGRRALAVVTDVPGTPATLMATSRRPLDSRTTNLAVILGALLIVMLVLIVLVGYVVSGLVTRPVEELVDAALAVSAGDLDQRVQPKGDVEVATLGRAFNQMTDNLRDQVRQLEQSRTDFRQAIARLGDVLVSTHDLDGMIDVVLETCALTLRADRAVFYARVAMPARIRATATYGGEVGSVELNGIGVAGAAAATLAPVRLGGGVELAIGEPEAAEAMAMPVISEGRLFGVIAVYGRQVEGSFTAEDVHTLQTLARQAEVAIGNVVLHDETRRQARTDGMTGLWNRREFELRCHEAIREAARFDEPFGVILVDVDDFKLVNDRFDHSTGDAALIWTAARISEATREVDVVARWGGEEFIVLLPRARMDETGVVAERVRAAVAKEPMRDGSRIIPLTVSVGYAGHPTDGATADELFKSADSALLRAKRLGKNRVERARPDEGVA